MHAHRKGDLTEAIVIAELKRRGIPVSVPFGDNERYDLVAESDEDLHRIQVKTGVVRDGAVVFRGNSQHTNAAGNTYKKYGDDIDAFVVYCHENEGLYLVSTTGFYNMRLRLDEPGQIHDSINWAAEYEFDAQWPPGERDVATASTVVERTVTELRERGVSVFKSGPAEDYDVLLERPDGRFARTSIRPGSVSEGRVRFDTGATRAPGPAEVDFVIVACAELDDVLLIERNEYETTTSFRVEEPTQDHPETRLAADYEFDVRWPPGG